MIDIRFSVAGPGRVGGSLAHWITAAGGRIQQVAARRPEAGVELADALGGRTVAIEQLRTEGEDLLLLAVSDPALETVVTRLAERPQAAVALHVSGAMPAEVLAPLRQGATAIGSLHPLRAFPRVETDARRARSILFGIDGDERAEALARRLVASWSARAVEIDPAARRLYHLAASLAAGGVVTVLAIAREIVDRTDLPTDVVDGYFALARQALDEAAAAEHPADAATGPAARGDADLVARQLVDLEASAPHLFDCVVALVEETRRAKAARASDRAVWDELGRILAKAKQRKSFLDP